MERADVAEAFLIILLALFSAPALTPALGAQNPDREPSPYMESCATLEIIRRAVDTVALRLTSMPCTTSDTASRSDRITRHLATLSAVTAVPVPIRLALLSPRLVAVRQFTENIQSGTATVSIAMVNETGADLRIPSWVFVSDAATRVRGTWLPEPWGRSFASVQTDYRYTTPDYAQADAPSPFKRQYQPRYRLTGRRVSPANVARLTPGDTTAELALTLTLNPNIELARLRLAVRALPASDEIPADLPDTLPTGLLAAARLVTVDSVATPFLRDLLQVRFGDTLSPLARQILLDRIGGRAVGTRGGDLVVQVESSADGRAVLRTWSRWRLEIAQALIRKLGVVTPRNVMEATAAARALWPQSDTTLPQISEDALQTYPHAYLLGEPSPGATPAEVRLALATVGARPVAEGTGWRSGTIARLEIDTSYDAHTAAAQRLQWLPVFGAVQAWPAYNPAESGAFHPFGGPPPKSEGTAWKDPRVTKFVAQANLPNLHAIRDLLAFPDHDLVFFTVIYGSAMDVYPNRTGLRFGTRIGWMDGNDSLTFRFRRDDTYLQGELIDTLRAIERGGPVNERWPYPFATQLYLPVLIVDPAVRISVLRRCARMMYTDERGCAVGAVRAAASRARDWETLTLLSFRGAHGYGNDAWAAQDTLATMALDLFKDRSVPPATWAAVTWSLGRYHTTKARDSLVVRRILMHPTLGRRLDILTPLVSLHFAFMADEVADRIPGSDSTRAAMRQVLRYPWGNGPLAVAALRQAVRTKDRAVLTVLANLFGVSQGIRAEAARHLPAGVIRRYDTYHEPPALR